MLSHFVTAPFVNYNANSYENNKKHQPPEEDWCLHFKW